MKNVISAQQVNNSNSLAFEDEKGRSLFEIRSSGLYDKEGSISREHAIKMFDEFLSAVNRHQEVLAERYSNSK